jgi:DNA-binding NarL/FixJ family response regulator
MKKIKILIADDHSIIRSGLRMLFRSEPEFSVVGEAENGEEALEKIAAQNPNIAILDISMPKINGIEATRVIKERHPSTKVLILTIYENEEYVNQMVLAGASGYVLKDAGKKELFAAVRAIAAGERFFSPGISKLMIDEFIKQAHSKHNRSQDTNSPLTSRETEVLSYIARGLTNSQIAKKLFLSIRTIDTHRNNLMQKLDIHDTAGLVRYAIEAGLLHITPKQQ